MEYQYIKAFLCVAKHLSFTKAASELNIAQSAISRQIKILEESVNDQLFVRTHKQVKLTQRGQHLFELWKDFEDRLLDDFFRLKKKKIRIGSMEGGINNSLIEKLKISGLIDKYQLEFKIHRSKELYQMLSEGELDYLIGIRDISRATYISIEIEKESKALVSKSPIPPIENEKHLKKWITKKHLIIYSENDELYPFINICRGYTQVNSYEKIRHIVNSGISIALIPKHLIYKNDSFRVRDWTKPSSTIHLTRLNYTELPEHFHEFEDLVKEGFLY